MSSSSSLLSKPTKSLVNSKVNLFQQHAAAAASASASLATEANKKSKETRSLESNFLPNKSFQFFEKKQTFSKPTLTVPPPLHPHSFSPLASASSSPSINCKYSNANANADTASAATVTSKLNTASNYDLSNVSGAKVNFLNVGDLNTTTSKSLPLITTTTTTTTTNIPETETKKNRHLYSSSSVSTSSLDVNNNGDECKRILVIKVSMSRPTWLSKIILMINSFIY
jgi:hypothetical protein